MMELIRPRTRADLARFVPDGGTMVELGVAAGDFACQLIRTNPLAVYEGIDRYADHHDLNEWKKAQQKITTTLREVRGRAGVIWMSTFAEQLHHYRDNSLDLVYIDGYAHTGQQGGQTIRDWYPKVRPGGILAGHDYHPKWRPTMDAVDEFVQVAHLQLNIIDELPFPSWWVVKPMDDKRSQS